MTIWMKEKWAEAEKKARLARKRCFLTKGKEPCKQVTCPRCNPKIRVPQRRR